MGRAALDGPIAARAGAARRSGWSERWPIFGSHVERLGLLRTVAGGGSMYLSAPLFGLFHLTVLPVFERVIAPLLGLELAPRRRLMVVDRHRIPGLPLLDRLNCAFCDWANGLALWIHDRLDALEGLDAVEAGTGEIRAGRRALLVAAVLPLAPLVVTLQLLGVDLIFGLLVSPPLSMQRLSRREARAALPEGFGSRHRGLARRLLRREKVFALRLTAALAQIESAWCPLRNLCPRAECQRPAHHEAFLEAEQIDGMRRILRERGTVGRGAPPMDPPRA